MTRNADTEQYVTECIGPREAGTLWSDGCGNTVRVLAVDRDDPRFLWSVTEVDEVGQQVGRERTHSTPWDYDRNRVVDEVTR